MLVVKGNMRRIAEWWRWGLCWRLEWRVIDYSWGNGWKA